MSGPECGATTTPDSFGVYLICDKPSGHDEADHHAWLIGNRKMTEWAWRDGEL